MRMLLPVAILSLGILWTTTAEAQPGRGPGGPDLKKLEAEIDKLKAALDEATEKLEKARSFNKDKEKADDRKRDERPKIPFGKEGKGKEGWGKEGWKKEGFGKMPFGKMPFGKGPWGGKMPFGKEGLEKGKATEKGKAAESERIIEQLKRILDSVEKKDEKKGPPRGGFGGFNPFGRDREAPKAAPGGDVEKRLRDIEKTLEEIRQSLRRR